MTITTKNKIRHGSSKNEKFAYFYFLANFPLFGVEILFRIKLSKNLVIIKLDLSFNKFEEIGIISLSELLIKLQKTSTFDLKLSNTIIN